MAVHVSLPFVHAEVPLEFGIHVTILKLRDARVCRDMLHYINVVVVLRLIDLGVQTKVGSTSKKKKGALMLLRGPWIVLLLVVLI